MEFMYTVTKNNQLIAGFTKYIDACIYKEFLKPGLLFILFSPRPLVF